MPGEIILEESPTAYAPSSLEDDACIVCLKLLKDRESLCSKCWWPLCSPACISSELHKAECQSLAACVGRPDDESLPFQHLLILRCILLRLRDKDSWERLFSLEDHHGIQTIIKNEKEEQDNPGLLELLSFIREDCGIGNVVEDDVIETLLETVQSSLIYTKCDAPTVKSFPALYLTGGIISHSCFENTRLVFHPKTFAVSVIACLPIRKGQKITRNFLKEDAYSVGTEERRALLRDNLIDCYCLRCTDPTECGSYSSAILCQHCDQMNSPVLPTNPLDKDGDWHCLVCGDILSSDFVRSLVWSSRDHLESCRDPLSLRGFLSSNRSVLHYNHFLMTSCKIKLFYFLGTKDTYSSIEDLFEKVRLGKEIMALAEILIPGLTVQRGKLLLRLGNAFQLLISRDLMNRIECRSEFGLAERQVLSSFEDTKYCYEEVLHILSCDTRKSAKDVETGINDALKTLEQMKVDFENSL